MNQGSIRAAWGVRGSIPAEIANATRTLISLLEPLLSLVDAPFGINEAGRINEDLSQLEAAFDAGRFIDDAGVPQPQRGFWCDLFATTGTQNISLSIQAGATEPVHRVPSNKVMLTVSGKFPFEAFRGLAEESLLPIVDVFNPAFGRAAEQVYLVANPKLPLTPSIGPFMYLADDFAAPPEVPGLTRAHHGNGTLLRLKPRWGENVWTDPALTERVINALTKAGWAPSLEHHPSNPA